MYEAMLGTLIDEARSFTDAAPCSSFALKFLKLFIDTGLCASKYACKRASSSDNLPRTSIGFALTSRRNTATGLSDCASAASSGIFAFTFSTIAIARSLMSPIVLDIAPTAAMLGSSVASWPGAALISSSEGNVTDGASCFRRSGYPMRSSSFCSSPPDSVRSSAGLGRLLSKPVRSLGIDAMSFSRFASGRRLSISLNFVGSAESVAASGSFTIPLNDSTSCG